MRLTKILCVLICVHLRGTLSIQVSQSRDYILNEIFGSDKSDKLVSETNSTLPLPGELPATEGNADKDEIGFGYKKTFVDFYYEGVEAYLANDWEQCIDSLERAIHFYKDYYEAVASCRIHCEFERNRHQPMFPVDHEHRQFFEGAIVKTLCMEKCRRKFISNLPRWFIFGKDEKAIFAARKPYQYLQLCYYKDDQQEKALMATYTALIVNVDDHLLRTNMQYYMDGKYTWADLKDLDELEFVKYYVNGVAEYKKENWENAISELETAVDLYLKEHDKCRAFCEGGFNQNWLPDFNSAISNHYIYTLRCKQNCTSNISYVHGRAYSTLLANMYDYLQFAYYKADNIKEAMRAVVSYMLFNPASEDMQVNLKFYRSLPDADELEIKERREATNFYLRELYDQKFLEFVDNEFGELAASEANANIDEFR